ncbi:cohesin domain-containing protein [Clostridium chauvoei]|uniref:Cohesin domain-containing protein n=3 Tax=Clostridium chauvoei TaxID=46867 RepID=S6F788_9CLOT|nr:cohesin domain-containing protein [Clostridium chauvoei]ATD54274.1 hypothetical protein BTM20_03090 [Clostridium chauvoei]MBX7279881.1 hypothetical protein [Clostridium chauvoei]MBX7282201.1 hypothetical protein [Clostridium chauvoei]MBX7284771.1 hypothetical protein [Clostridium chauvoei]MBX7287109.1 hypothetical protein [Clostridium chauvoei]
MKKIISFLIIFLSIFTTKAFAVNDASVNFDIEGQAKVGNEITININVDNVTRLYAMSVNYIYNPEEIKVKSIEGAGLIKESKDNCVELGGDTAKDGNRAVYQMTFTGKVDGITGSGNIVKIKADVLKDTDLKVTKDNMDVKLIGVNEAYEVSKMPFNFNDKSKPQDEKKGEEATTKKEDENKKDDSTKEETKKVETKTVENVSTSKKPSLYKKILSFLGLNKEEKTQVEEIAEESQNSEEKTSEENKNSQEKSEEAKNDEKKPEEKALAENKEEKKIAIGTELAILAIVIVVATTTIIIKKRKNK